MSGILGSTLGAALGHQAPRCTCRHQTPYSPDPYQQMMNQMLNAQLSGPGSLGAALGTAPAIPIRAPKPKPSDHETRNPPAFSEATASRLLWRSIRAFQPKR